MTVLSRCKRILCTKPNNCHFYSQYLQSLLGYVRNLMGDKESFVISQHQFFGPNIRSFSDCLLRTDFCHHKLSQGLTMAIGPSVMFLWLHFIHNNFRAFQLFQNFCLDRDTLQVWLSNMEFPIMFECKHSTKIDFIPRFSLQHKNN